MFILNWAVRNSGFLYHEKKNVDFDFCFKKKKKGYAFTV